MSKKKALAISIFLIAFVAVILLLTTSVKGYTYTDANGLTWYFSISGTNATNVYLYSGNVSSLTTLEIPRTLSYNGTEYTVTSLRGYETSTSSSSTYRRNIIYGVTRATSNSTITKIIIPDTVTTIGINTFANFTGMTKFVTKDSAGNETEGLPSNLLSIATYAFYGCNKLEIDLVIPDTVIGIGTYCFYNNAKLKSLTIGKGMISIPDYSFYNCAGLKEIEIPNTVTSIGYYSFANCSGATTISIPDSVTTVGNSAFSSCRALKEIVIPTGLTTISYNMFSGCSALTKVEIPNNITKIDQYAFSSCNNLKEVKLGTGVTSIGNYAFRYCSKLEKINLTENLTTIGNSVFADCISLRGDITIPDSVTSLGSGVFTNCTGIDGTIRIGDGVKTIQSSTFYNCKNAKKIVLGTGVTSLASYSCEGITDIWIENTEENVSVAQYVAGRDAEINIHWLGCDHKVKISTPSNVKIVNSKNDEEITTNGYSCDASLNFKVVDSKNRDNLILTMVENGDYDNATVLKVEDGKTYKIDRIIRDYEILVQDISKETDLSLRTYISQINRTDVNTSREPIVESEAGEIKYKHTKYPLAIKKGDLVTFTFRVYNEGGKPGKATEINAYIPKGLTFVSDNRINQRYNWVKAEDGKLTTDFLKDTEIKSNKGILKLDYYDVELVLEVTENISTDKDKRLVVLGEIGKQNSDDADSTPGNESNVKDNYKEEESNNSTTSSYIAGNEDDDDFDSVILIGKIKVDYTIKINKIDSETDELLAGARFNLLDSKGKVLKTKETSKDGTLDFGVMTTYGEGEDVYYIEEAHAPEGYTVLERSKLKVVVLKTLENEETREYSVKVTCDVLDYNVDTTRYEYTPIYTKEQLAKIGSGETVTIDGVNYKYDFNANYKLMADIDLAGEQWTPISREIKCVLDGNGHKISNLTITSDEEMQISEIGLFRSFAGIVEDLELENVNINISTINENAESISGHPCVGAFAGFMEEGTIRNCKVSGNIIATTDNIGGFVGHTAEENMVKIQKSVNNANVTGTSAQVEVEGVLKEITSSNVGGFIGCALGAVSVTDCTNNGNITCAKYNAGGIVGYVKATDYHEVNIKADFSEEDKMITLVVENNKTEGQYAIELENLDAKTLGLIEGAKYTILDKDKNVMPNCEEVELKSGSLRVATVNIQNLGVDTYYIEELEPAEGYSKNTGIIKLEVRRYWDTETEKFKVSVNTENMTDNEVQEDEPKEDNEPSSSSTGEIFARVDFENISWNVNKAEFVGCTNNGIVVTNYMNAAGIVGTAHCVINIEDCINKGAVAANNYGNAAGIISEIRDEELMNYIKISNCKNEGEITSDSKSYYGSAGAIIANAKANIEIERTENTGKVTGTAVSGCIADFNGILLMKECTNEGEIRSTVAPSNYGNVNAPAAGLIAKNYVGYGMEKSANQLYIENCENTGDIYGDCHTGGIAGNITAKVFNAKNCDVHDCKIVDLSAGDKGGIIGFDSADQTFIMNCNVDNVEMERTSEHTGSTYGTTGGIIGNFCKWSGGVDTNIESVKVINCKVTNSDITARSNSVGGIIGGGYGCYEKTNIEVYDSIVDECNILNKEIVSSTYSGAAGILGKAIYGGAIKIDNCLVNNSNIESRKHETKTGAYDQDVGGILGMSWDGSGLEITNCDVLDCEILSKATESDSCANIGGLVGGVGCNSYYNNTTAKHLIDNCNVKNTNIETNAGNLAGGLAMSYYVPGYYNISNCNVDNVSMKSTAGGSSYNSNCTTGGIVANAFSLVDIKDCNVSNSTIEGQGRNVGGILANILDDSKHSFFERCTVYNTTIKNTVQGTSSTCDIVAGIAACVRSATIKDCTVDECIIYGKEVANATGMIGTYIGGNNLAIAKNCKVTNTEITSEQESAKSSSNSTAAGMFGRVNNQTLDMSDCLVENCTITGRGSIVSGVAANGQTCIANNISVKNITLNSLPTQPVSTTYGAYRSTGGVIGSFTSNSEITNINVEDITINGETGTTGGIIGFTTTLNKMENCSVKDINIENTSSLFMSKDSIGGLIGVTTNIDGSIKNNTVSNMTVETEDLNVGGIMGFASSSNETTFENCDVSDVNITNKNVCTKTNGAGHLGGILGVTTATVVLDDCDVTEGTLEIKSGTNSGLDIGGLIGYSFNSTANNCDISNVEMQNKTSGHTGGLVGMVNYNSSTGVGSTLNVSNSTVGNHSIIKGGSGHTAGLLGFGKIDITSASVDNITVESTNNTAAGIIAHALLGSKVDNGDVSNSTIKGGYQAGGIAGYSASDITNCNVTKTNIHTISNNGVVGGIVGIISESSSEIKNCTVSDSSSITGINGYTGGIAGFANNTINNCEVSDTTIKATGDSAYGLGGIVGHGSNYDATSTYIKKCSVRNCEIAGLDAVGGIAGAAVPFIEECAVDGEEIELETAKEVSKTKSVMIENIELNNNKETQKEQEKVQETKEAKEEKAEEAEEVQEEAKEEQVEEVQEEAKEEQEIEVQEVAEEEQAEEVQEEAKEEQVEEVQEEAKEEQEIEVQEVAEEEQAEEEQVEEVQEEAKEEQAKEVQEETKEEKAEEVQEEAKEEKVEEVEEVQEEAKEEQIEETKKESNNAVKTLAEGEEVEKEYSTKISGRKFVGGIIGMGGQLFNTNTFVTITDCILRGIEVSGTDFVEEAIGRTSYYNDTDTIVYDIIINLIKENVISNIEK